MFLYRNVAGQIIDFIMLKPNATTGLPEAVTASVTVTVKLDTGSYGSSAGTLTHKTGGAWQYQPTQGETDADDVTLLATATDAVPRVIHCKTTDVIPGVNVTQISGDADAAQNLAASASVIHRGSVTGAATTTTLIDSSLAALDADHWRGKILHFKTGDLAKQATDIVEFDEATDKITFTAITRAPELGDEYVVL